ncbi:hypothetical protein NKI19_08450 [Mesorhizobium sp. M0751]|uniref:hypothetical protein n=1 Tax=unclassified Mesorhizobium TaxID=325217 RepID=UPI003339D4ED
MGDVEDYKHFLPRILEQAIRQPEWMGTDPPIIAVRLKMANWLDWPSSERAAIRTLFVEAWTQSVQEHPDDVDAEVWTCGAAILNLDVPTMLEKWLAEPSLNAAMQLAEFLAAHAASMFEDDINERAYWSYVDETTLHLVRRWLLSDPVLRLLLTARSKIAATDQWLIGEALKRLVSLGRSSVQ